MSSRTFFGALSLRTYPGTVHIHDRSHNAPVYIVNRLGALHVDSGDLVAEGQMLDAIRHDYVAANLIHEYGEFLGAFVAASSEAIRREGVR